MLQVPLNSRKYQTHLVLTRFGSIELAGQFPALFSGANTNYCSKNAVNVWKETLIKVTANGFEWENICSQRQFDVNQLKHLKTLLKLR